MSGVNCVMFKRLNSTGLMPVWLIIVTKVGEDLSASIFRVVQQDCSQATSSTCLLTNCGVVYNKIFTLHQQWCENFKLYTLCLFKLLTMNAYSHP